MDKKHDGVTYEANSLDEFFSWLGPARYQEIGFGEGRSGLKWSQGVVACIITDEMILNMADESIFAFDEYFGRATESKLAPVPLWRANWSDQDSLNLVRSMLNKPWFKGMEDEFSLNLTSLRNKLRLNPLRIYRPGAEPGTEPVYNVSTIMSALDVHDASDDKTSDWTESDVEFFAWDILQGGFDFFSSLKKPRRIGKHSVDIHSITELSYGGWRLGYKKPVKFVIMPFGLVKEIQPTF